MPAFSSPPAVARFVDLYGLGTENENLPGFITLCPPETFGGSGNYASAFLPAIYQGTRIGSNSQPIASATISNLHNPVRLPYVAAGTTRLLQT